MGCESLDGSVASRLVSACEARKRATRVTFTGTRCPSSPPTPPSRLHRIFHLNWQLQAYRPSHSLGSIVRVVYQEDLSNHLQRSAEQKKCGLEQLKSKSGELTSSQSHLGLMEPRSHSFTSVCATTPRRAPAHCGIDEHRSFCRFERRRTRSSARKVLSGLWWCVENPILETKESTSSPVESRRQLGQALRS